VIRHSVTCLAVITDTADGASCNFSALREAEIKTSLKEFSTRRVIVPSCCVFTVIFFDPNPMKETSISKGIFFDVVRLKFQF